MSEFKTSEKTKEALEKLSDQIADARTERDRFYLESTPKINDKEVSLEEWKSITKNNHKSERKAYLLDELEDFTSQANEEGQATLTIGQTTHTVPINTQEELDKVQQATIGLIARHTKAEFRFYEINNKIQDAVVKKDGKFTEKEVAELLGTLPEAMKNAKIAEMDIPSVSFNLYTLEEAVLMKKDHLNDDDKAHLKLIGEKKESIKEFMEERAEQEKLRQQQPRKNQEDPVADVNIPAEMRDAIQQYKASSTTPQSGNSIPLVARKSAAEKTTMIG